MGWCLWGVIHQEGFDGGGEKISCSWSWSDRWSLTVEVGVGDDVNHEREDLGFGLKLELGLGLVVVAGEISASRSWVGRVQGVSQESRKRCMRAAPDGEGERHGGENWVRDSGCWLSGRGDEQGEKFKIVGFCSSVDWVEGEVDAEVDDTLSSGLAGSFVGRSVGVRGMRSSRWRFRWC